MNSSEESQKLTLLTREQFKTNCLKRDQHRCVVCHTVLNLSVHHLIERRLFRQPHELGGYYLDNGVTLCEEHHWQAENTTLSCCTLRELAGITTIVVPECLDSTTELDKWGNTILPSGLRLPGELFHEAPVQKMLSDGNVLSLFTNRVKYPRTYHLPWSPGRSADDKVLKDTSSFQGKEVVVSIKYDGECTTFYHNYLHARSLEYHAHPSRDLIKQLHATMAHDIPENWRICAENVYAQHSIYYRNLASYLLVHSIWNDNNICLSWDETVEWATLLNLATVDVIYRGIFDEDTIRGLYSSTYQSDECEGYVVRVADSFPYHDFTHNVGKFVRAAHVQTTTHWMTQAVKPNQLR